MNSGIQLPFRIPGVWFSIDSWSPRSNDTRHNNCAGEVIRMSIKFGNSFTIRFIVSLVAASALVFSVSTFAQSTQVEDSRTSKSQHLIQGGRTSPDQVAVTDEEYAALALNGGKSEHDSRAGATKPGAGSSTAQSAGFDFWFYDVDVQTFNDDDFDGYYHGIDVLFDVDTNFGAADVYAVLYLSFDGGPWNEYAVSEDFSVFGTSANDEYVLVTELMSGYPTGSYDLLIELFDAHDGTFLASTGPEDSSEMSNLPLEDFNRDAPAQEVIIVESHGGGGVLDKWTLGILLTLLVVTAFRRIWRHRNDAIMRIDSPAPIWNDARKSTYK